MAKRQIINIINFIRGVEPRTDADLYKPVVEQIKLLKKYNFKGTFLIQYDALLMPEYVELLKELDPKQFELGVWFEVVQQQCEACGIKWTGRYSWDWHVHCGFSMGYTKQQREALVDVLFEKFKDTFGYYPRVFGSWFFDSHTLRYANEKYGLDAACNCKEQYGTDGYTLWGGYYGQAYYPAKKNIFLPAQSAEQQLDTPIFRMLGSDPVYQYDFGMSLQDGAQAVQGVITLEPVYNGGGGGVPEWVDWFMKENFNGDCLSFGYAQAGQENSFGWEMMGNGLTYQFKVFDEYAKAGKIEIETLGESGRFFKKEYSSTPASAITAHTAHDDSDISSIWYCSDKYRVNVYYDHGALHIRDMHIFDENYTDPFEDTVCESDAAAYDTLPVIDGNRHTGNGVRAGIYFTDKNGEKLALDKPVFTDLGEGSAKLDCTKLSITLERNKLSICGKGEFVLETKIGKFNDHVPTVTSRTAKKISLNYRDFDYSLGFEKGTLDEANKLTAENGEIVVVVE